MSTSIKYKSLSAEETEKLGEKLGKLLVEPEIILLEGSLGAGKTVFVKGIARGLNIEENVNSPSYTLIKEYKGKLPLYHMDLYRLDDINDLYDIGFADYLDNNGVVVIEWPELARDFLPRHYIAVNFVIIDNNKREIEISAGENIRKGLLTYVNHRN